MADLSKQYPHTSAVYNPATKSATFLLGPGDGIHAGHNAFCSGERGWCGWCVPRARRSRPPSCMVVQGWLDRQGALDCARPAAPRPRWAARPRAQPALARCAQPLQPTS